MRFTINSLNYWELSTATRDNQQHGLDEDSVQRLGETCKSYYLNKIKKLNYL